MASLVDTIETGLPEEGMTVEDTINAKLDELLRVCLDNNVPFFAIVALEGDNKTNYLHRAVAPVELSQTLTDDKITKYAASLNNNLVLKIKKDEASTFSGDLFGDVVEEDY